MMMYDSSTEFNLNRAVESIKLAQQKHKRELEKKDEDIASLQKRLEELQYEAREFTDVKRLKEKENRELLSANQYLRHELTMEQAENERLKGEMTLLQQDLTNYKDKVVHLENENGKANHIIKNLLKKFQLKRPPTPPQSQSLNQNHLQHHHHHHHQLPNNERGLYPAPRTSV